MNTDQIRSAIATFEEKLSAVAGAPILIEQNFGEGWRNYHRRPALGALVEHRWPGREIGEGRIWWHGTLEAAKAHLLAIGRDSGFEVAEGGLYLQMAGDATAYITRLGGDAPAGFEPDANPGPYLGGGEYYFDLGPETFGPYGSEEEAEQAFRSVSEASKPLVGEALSLGPFPVEPAPRSPEAVAQAAETIRRLRDENRCLQAEVDGTPPADHELERQRDAAEKQRDALADALERLLSEYRNEWSLEVEGPQPSTVEIAETALRAVGRLP